MSTPPGSIDDELAKEVKAPISPDDYSFNYDRFKKSMSSFDPVALILKGHLFIEYIFIRHIEMSFGRSDDLDTDRMSFPLKVALSRRFMGKNILIDACLFLNHLRNKVAHNIDFEIGEKEVNALLKKVDKHLRTFVVDLAKRYEADGGGKSDDYIYTLQAILVTMIMMLEIQRIERERCERVLRRRLDDFMKREERRSRDLPFR